MRTTIGRFAVAAIATAILFAVSAGAASAAVFYVNGKTGLDTNPCISPAAPCKTIAGGIAKSESSPEVATIEVAAGNYEEAVGFSSPGVSGLTLNGAGPATQILGPTSGSTPTVGVGPAASPITISNLAIVNRSGDEGAALAAGGAVELLDDQITVHNPKGAFGIRAESFGVVSASGVEVTMASGTEGGAIGVQFTPLEVTGGRIDIASGSKAAGIEALSPTVATITGTQIVDNGEGSTAPLVFLAGSPQLSGLTIEQNAPSGSAITFQGSRDATVTSTSVKMGNAASKSYALVEALSGTAYQNVTVSGPWQGGSFEAEGGSPTILDSRLGGGGNASAVAYIGASGTSGMLIQRSIVQSTPAAGASLVAVGGDLTLDSSEVLGGQMGIFVEPLIKTHAVTIASSTIDAGEPGVADPTPVRGVSVRAENEASAADVAIEGSVVLEPAAAELPAPGGEVTISCLDSDAPSQAQAASGTEGAIECGSGVAGNAAVGVAALFGSPFGSYAPIPGSPAVDSVPAGAIALPAGLTASTTDLLGNPRVVDGNGDCVALQDRGVIELQGHSAGCPKPPSPASPAVKAGVISGLAISPSAFAAAPSGPTVTASERFGATISWRDSAAATTTFTVLRPLAGRKQGHSCRKPGKRNAKGRRCVRYVALGGFTHADVAGAEKLHFSGRLKGRRLAKGSYRLQAVARNAAGSGPAAARSFTIK